MKIFLDDTRVPIDAFYMWAKLMFKTTDWTVVRTYDEFVNTIESVSFEDIEFISFDHDLADVKNGEEKTGFDCAKWLVNYCMDNDYNIPNYYVHSQNPVGRENIKSYIENYKKYVRNNI